MGIFGHRRHLENLLAGHADDGSDDALARLLDSARATGTTHEVAGLDSAVAAFHSSDAPDADAASPRRWRSALLGGFATATLTTKLVAGAAAAAAIGGVAVAATTYHAPHRSQSSTIGSAVSSPGNVSSHDTNRSHGGSQKAPASLRPPAIRTTKSTPQRSGLGTPAPRVPNPSLLGLCQAWSNKPHEHGKSEDSRAFRQLIRAAGGVDNVDAFCASLTNASGSKSPKPHGSAPAPRTKSKPAKSPHKTKTPPPHAAPSH